MTTVLDRDRRRLLAAISPEERDPSLARFRALAVELGIHLHIGSMAIRLGDDAVANRAFVIAPDGDIVARYDKIHMFDVDLGGGESYRESRLYRPGDGGGGGRTAVGAARAQRLLRRSFPASLSFAGAGGRDGDRDSGRVHPHDRRGALACAGPRAGDRDRGVRHRGGARRPSRGRPRNLRPFDDRRSVGNGSSPRRSASRASSSPTSIRRQSATARRRIPALANDRPFTPPARPAQRLKSVS